jgi:hypothetical protein
MLFDPKKLDWDKLASLHEQYRDRLRGLAYDRKSLIHKLPDLQRARKTARLEYKEALEDAKDLISTIEEISLRLKALKAEWEERPGGNVDNFYLNIKANRLLIQFARCKKDRKEVIIVNRKKTEAAFRALERQYKDHIKSVRACKINYAAVQRLMDENSTIIVLVNYVENVSHYCDATAETQVFKLSFRKRTYTFGKSASYIKNDGTWYIVDKHGEPQEACSQHEQRKLEQLINKRLR